MPEVVISVPEELKEELKQISKVEWSLVINRLVKNELSKLLEVKSILAKSKLSEKDVKEISEKVDNALSERFLASKK